MHHHHSRMRARTLWLEHIADQERGTVEGGDEDAVGEGVGRSAARRAKASTVEQDQHESRSGAAEDAGLSIRHRASPGL